jgi:hypothetical protein
LEHVTKFLDKYDVSKSCGYNGAHTGIFRALSESKLMMQVTTLLQLCAQGGHTEKIFPINRTPEAKDIDEHRPIAQTLMLRRAFE